MIDATSTINQKVDASCDIDDLMEKIDATYDIDELIQKIDATCAT
jgi:hypothetical protein